MTLQQPFINTVHPVLQTQTIQNVMLNTGQSTNTWGHRVQWCHQSCRPLTCCATLRLKPDSLVLCVRRLFQSHNDNNINNNNNNEYLHLLAQIERIHIFEKQTFSSLILKCTRNVQFVQIKCFLVFTICKYNVNNGSGQRRLCCNLGPRTVKASLAFFFLLWLVILAPPKTGR